jgi:hypothetical protein
MECSQNLWSNWYQVRFHPFLTIKHIHRHGHDTDIDTSTLIIICWNIIQFNVITSVGVGHRLGYLSDTDTSNLRNVLHSTMFFFFGSRRNSKYHTKQIQAHIDRYERRFEPLLYILDLTISTFVIWVWTLWYFLYFLISF